METCSRLLGWEFVNEMTRESGYVPYRKDPVMAFL